ncbi:MAG: PQQ-binding-like beta-propeller repeat protein [Planctomycetaceae bacterium]|nr:PQQ-binding-like beta-propeller repeat protein [Planctomycetaceae bacterium]
MNRLTLSLFAVTIAALVETTGSAQEWTRFRGPNGTGESETSTIPASWTEKDLNWKVELPGVGHSSPVLWGEKIFLLSADPKNATRYVLCLSAADGSTLWRRDYPGVTHKLHGKSSYGSCTPACDAKQVYVAWSDPESTRLFAFDHGGNEKWSIDLGPWVSQHGFGTSPMLYEDLVVITVSQEPAKNPADPREPKESFIVAVDQAGGKIRWRTPLKVDTACYTVPCIRKNDAGQEELISCSTAEGIFALDPRSGRQLWSAPDVFTMRTVSSPVLASGLIFGSTGQGAGGHYLVALKPGPQPTVAYEVKEQANYVPTPVTRGELMFLWADKSGVVTCINSATGKQIWQERVGGAFYGGSPVRSGDKLFIVDETGIVFCLAAGPKFKLLGRTELGEMSRSTPAIAGGRMYVRTISHLYSVGGKATAAGE